MPENDQERVMQARIQRGLDATRLLNDPLLKQALESMERDIMISANALPASDYAGRDTYWRELGALASFRVKLQSYVMSGKAAQTNLDKLIQAAKKLTKRDR